MSSKPRKEYSVGGVSGKEMIGHASKVYPCSTTMYDQPMQKGSMKKESLKGYDKKAFDYKY